MTSRTSQQTTTATPNIVAPYLPPEQPPTKIAMSPAEYDTYLVNKLNTDQTLSTKVPVKQTVGKSQLGLMCPQPPYATGHDAIPLLQGYAENGCPVDCGED